MRNRDDFNELLAAKVLSRVASAKSFNRAAKSLGKSTSSVTRLVAELERRLGSSLLSRTTRKVAITEAGQAYLAHAERMLAARGDAHEAVRELSGGPPRGVLRVSMPVVVGERVLGPHLAAFRLRYPEITLQLDLSDRAVALVPGGFDLSLRIGRLADSSQRAQRLGSVELMLVASPDYLEHSGPLRRPQDLARHNCILVRQLPQPVRWSLFRKEERVDVDVDGWLQTTSTPLAASMAQAGVGVVRISSWVVREELERGALARVLPRWSCHDPRASGVGLHVVYAQTAGVPIPAKSQVFVEFVHQLARGIGQVGQSSGYPRTTK